MPVVNLNTTAKVSETIEYQVAEIEKSHKHAIYEIQVKSVKVNN